LIMREKPSKPIEIVERPHYVGFGYGKENFDEYFIIL